MEYNLKFLIKNESLKKASLLQIIEQLNKVGIETEHYKIEKANLIFDLKIPADRSDLKNYYYFANEFFLTLNIKQKKQWKNLKKIYLSSLKINSKENENLTFSIMENQEKLLKTKVNEKFNDLFQKSYSLELKNNNLSTFLYNLFQLYKIEKLILSYSKNFYCIQENKIVSLRINRVKSFLGEKNYKDNLFIKLPFQIVGESKEKLFFLIPNYRKDIEREIDLIEEYCKLLSYDKILVTYPKLNIAKKNKEREQIQQIKNYFLLANYNEIFTNSLTSEKKEKNSINLLNPISQDFENLNQCFKQNHLTLIEKHFKNKKEEIKFFEIARLFSKNNEQIKEGDFFQFLRTKQNIKTSFANSWLEVKGECDQFFDFLGISNIKTFVLSNNNSLSDKIIYTLKGKSIAQLVAINDKIQNKRYVFIFQLNLSTLFEKERIQKIKKVKEISKYPEIEKDLSFICSRNINLQLLKQELEKKYYLIQDLSFFDLYTEKNKSKIGIRLKFQSFASTLTKEEIEKELNNICIYLKDKYYLIIA